MIQIYIKEKIDLANQIYVDCINNKSRQLQSYKTSVTLFIYFFQFLHLIPNINERNFWCIEKIPEDSS